MTLKAFFHPSLMLVVVLAAIATSLSQPLQLQAAMRGLATAIFGVAGTMVALVLPAAELMGQASTRIADYWLNRIHSTPELGARSTAATIGAQFIKSIRELGTSTWRGSIYVMASFVLSAVALFSPASSLTFPAQALLLDQALLYLSASFLLVGAFWFFPAALEFYRLRTLEDLQAYLEFVAQSPQLPNAPPGSNPSP